MILSTQQLPLYFTIADSSTSHVTVPTNFFDFVDRGQDILTVTVGDSWTYGSDLLEHARLDQVFGNLVSKTINSDWLNLGQPGSNNFYIAEKVEELAKIIPQLHYKKIYLICTFTETGRSFNSHHDVYIDYVNWFANNSITNFLEFLNAECMRRILLITNQHNISLRTGTNFIDPIGIDIDFVPWFRQIGIPCERSACVGSTGAKKLQAVQQFTTDQTAYKEWFYTLVDCALHVDKVCRSSKLINQHPTSVGHQVYAKSILESLL